MKTIKLILATLILASSMQLVQAQSNDFIRLMDDLEGEDGVTSVLVTKKMFQLFTRTTDLEVEGQSLNDVIGNLDELKVIEIGNFEKAAKDLRSEVTAILKRDKFEPLMKVVEDDELVEISILEKEGVVRHLIMYIEEREEDAISLISITGMIDLDEISKLSGTLNIEGLELLEEK